MPLTQKEIALRKRSRKIKLKQLILALSKSISSPQLILITFYKLISTTSAPLISSAHETTKL
jgi:hypothetical protein